jgi:hypothetical protein
VRWNPGDVDTRPGEFTVGEFLSDLQRLIQAVQSMRYARDGVPDPEPTDRDVRNALELLLTAGRDDPVPQALAAGVAANSPMRAAAFRRFGSRRRFKQPVESSAPAIRDVHRRLRETIAAILAWPHDGRAHARQARGQRESVGRQAPRPPCNLTAGVRAVHYRSQRHRARRPLEAVAARAA